MKTATIDNVPQKELKHMKRLFTPVDLLPCNNALSSQPQHVQKVYLSQISTAIDQRFSSSLNGTKARADRVNQTVDLCGGDIEYFPTWSFWGRTFIDLENIGTVPTVVMVNESHVLLEPGQIKTEHGCWAAFLIRIINANAAMHSLVRVAVR